MLSTVDADKNDMINFSEFLTATVTKDLYLLSDKLNEAFKAFDRDGSGFITLDELMNVIGGEESFEMDRKAWDKVIGEVDFDGDGKINFEEFVKLMNE